MAEQQLNAHAIELLTKLADEAGVPEVIDIVTEGLGGGLPSKLPVAFNRKTQTFGSIKSLIEEFRTAPDRRKGSARVDTLRSFIDLVNRHKDEQSALFGKTSYPDPKLTAVLNYYSAGTDVRFGDHRIVYAFPLTDEFKAWVNGSGTAMPQEVFCAFLEEHAAELAAPTDGERSEYERLFKEDFANPSQVLELSRYLEVYVSAKAKQGVRLSSGERVVEFSEDHLNAKGEKVTIPGIFMVSVPAFIDGDAVRIPARLRYRISGGDIKWFYDLYRWQFYLREEVGHNLRAASDETSLQSFEGAPEA